MFGLGLAIGVVEVACVWLCGAVLRLGVVIVAVAWVVTSVIEVVRGNPALVALGVVLGLWYLRRRRRVRSAGGGNSLGEGDDRSREGS